MNDYGLLKQFLEQTGIPYEEQGIGTNAHWISVTEFGSRGAPLVWTGYGGFGYDFRFNANGKLTGTGAAE